MDVDNSSTPAPSEPSQPANPSTPTTLRLPIDASHVMMFARSLGQRVDGPDDLADRDIPVTFPVALAQFDPDYELRPHPDHLWFGSGAGPGYPRTTTDPRTRLHAEQHFEYHRRVKPGETLTASRRPGKTWTKTSSRGGELTFIEAFTDFVDVNDSPVVTSRSVSVLLPLAQEASS